MLVISIPLLVVFKGGDALSVCFNTIAVVFMCDIDNVCYTMGMAEKVRARVELAGRVTLTKERALNLFYMKLVHVAAFDRWCPTTTPGAPTPSPVPPESTAVAAAEASMRAKILQLSSPKNDATTRAEIEPETAALAEFLATWDMGDYVRH
jgi:hypothetical protein